MIQLFMDEGTSEPFVARLWGGVFGLRDLALTEGDDHARENKRREFDDLYSPVLDALGATRNAQKRIASLIEGHKARLASGEIVSYQRNALELGESISLPLQEAFSTFLSAAVRATKTLQLLLRFLGVDVGCLFVKDANFQKGIQAFRAQGQDGVADYLQETRAGWSELLIKRRDDHEHNGWRLPDVKYSHPSRTPVEMLEPVVDGTPVSQYTAEMLAHLLAFVEDLIAYAVQCHLAAGGASLADTPPEKRDPSNPTRFYLTVPSIQPNAPVWTLKYSSKGFP